MNVLIAGYRYLVITPVGARFYVAKDQSCTCGVHKCLHREAVALYLKMRGAKAPAPEPRPTLSERAERLKTFQKDWLANLCPMNAEILAAFRVKTPEERVAWIAQYGNENGKTYQA